MANGAAGNAGGGGGGGGWGGALGGGLSSASNIASNIYQIVQAGRESTEGHMARRQWERMRAPVSRLFEQTYYAPFAQNVPIPYSADKPQDWHRYQWAAPESLRGIYSSYLGRQYGLPETIARRMSSQALSPYAMGAMPQQQFTPGGAFQAMQADPNALAGAYLQTHVPQMLRQQDYLQNAARLAAFNLQRAQMLPELIG